MTVDKRFREMVETDLQQIMRIERQCHLVPWSASIFKDCMDVGYHCLVLEQDHAVIAYAVMSVAVNEAHIFNICVSNKFQRKGYGREVLDYLIGMARLAKANSIYLEVRPSNVAAVSLYKNMGFSQIGVRKNYYPAQDGREDALIFAFDL